MPRIKRNSNWSYELFWDDNDVKWRVHKRRTCQESHCAIHNPSEHPLKGARIVLQVGSPFSFKPHGFAERVCEHGYAHSDPDSVAFYDSVGYTGTSVHGCDGCCVEGLYEKLNGDNSGIGNI